MKTTQASENSTEVLISGAGPTGLMLANLLLKENISFRIVETDSVRHKESRALAIQPRSMELLQSIGVVEKFLAAGLRGAGISIRVKGKPAAHFDFSDIGRDDTPFPYLLFLSQSVTEAILEDALNSQGAQVERQTSLASFEQNSDRVVAKLKHADGKEETLTAQYLVGCDGARSQVRQSSGLGFSGGTYNAEFMLADAKINWDLPSDRLTLLLGDQKLAIVMPLKGSDLSRVITIGDNSKETKEAAANLTTKMSATIQDVQEVFQEAASEKIQLTEPQWVTRYRIHHRSVEKMKVGRVFLAGDAAHIHSPAGGQGMNTGLQDASNLGWKLARVLRNEASVEILETYNSERWPIAQKLLNFTDRIFTFAASQSPLTKKLRNIVVPLVTKILMGSRFGRKYLFGFVSQLNIHYHASSVVIEDLRGPSRENKVGAGHRAPNAQLKDGKSIFELIQGYQFSVLVLTRQKISTPAREQFKANWKQQNKMGAGNAAIHWIDKDVSSEALKTYQVDGTLVCLIRPDGYIGYQADHLD